MLLIWEEKKGEKKKRYSIYERCHELADHLFMLKLNGSFQNQPHVCLSTSTWYVAVTDTGILALYLANREHFKKM